MVSNDLIARLLPVLGRSLDNSFNVFDVMHHGSHEKQLSNVFSWILDAGETHNFEVLGQRLFVELINDELVKLGRDTELLPASLYRVHQEVNTAEQGEPGDIADIILESDSAVIAVRIMGPRTVMDTATNGI